MSPGRLTLIVVAFTVAAFPAEVADVVYVLAGSGASRSLGLGVGMILLAGSRGQLHITAKLYSHALGSPEEQAQRAALGVAARGLRALSAVKTTVQAPHVAWPDAARATIPSCSAG